jgi:hypothetical protein
MNVRELQHYKRLLHTDQAAADVFLEKCIGRKHFLEFKKG